MNENKQFIGAKEICEIVDCGLTMAYGIIRQLNEELEAKGYLVFRGKVYRKYFMERLYPQTE